MTSLMYLWTCSNHHLRKQWEYVIWVKSCKYWNEIEYGLTKDGWLWYYLPDNTQEPGDTPCSMVMLQWGVFLDGPFI